MKISYGLRIAIAALATAAHHHRGAVAAPAHDAASGGNAAGPAPPAPPVKTSPGPSPPTESAPARSEFKSYTEKVQGTKIAFDLVAIPGGKFVMGSPAREKGRGKDEGPAHEVAVRPFWMTAREVSWDEYGVYLQIGIKNALKAAAEDAPDALTYPTPPYEDETFGHGKNGQPTIALTHHAVQEYARWLSSRTGKTYRLPTEAEWEYACRAGTTTATPLGDSPRNLGEHAVFAANSGKRPNPVGTKRPNAFGLHDMLGNVAEWVLDQYDAGFYARARPGALPVNLPGDRRYPHVVRGGGWRDKGPALRCAARRASEKRWSRQDPQTPQSIWWHTEATDVGFRLVRPVEDYPELQGLRSKMTPDSPY